MHKAIIFDLDGTLGDTLPLCLAAFRTAIEPLAGRRISDADIIATFGPSEEATVKALLPDRYEEGIHGYWRQYKAMHDLCPQPFAGIPELLRELRARGVFLGMVTGKARPSADASLERFGLADFFDECEYGWIHGPRKPDAIRSMLGRRGLVPAETAYVGDAPSDIAAAREAGVTMYSAAWASTADEATVAQVKALEPDGIFYRVEDFSAFVLSLR
ncbi:MAG: HAD hydrolase-like protein [Planctomycetaceae bacterium]|nr:HAD hydrolase-like protein [Planctomycetaceae bacterium]